MQFDNFALKTNVLAFASRSKAQGKPRRPSTACSWTRTVSIRERKWNDIELGAQHDQAYPLARRLNTLLRHGEFPREEDGNEWILETKDYLRNDFENSQHWSDEMWKSTMAKGRGNKKRFQHCTDLSGQENLHLRALQGHSGRNLIDPSLQDNVVNSERLRRVHLSHRVVQSIHTSSQIQDWYREGQHLGKKRQTVFFLPLIPMDKEHKGSAWNKPCH